MLTKPTNIKYLSIVDGRLAQSASATTEGAEKFTTKEGKEKFYLFFKSVIGKIASITNRPPPDNHQEWSHNWLIKIVDDDETYQLQMPYSSGYANAFFSILPNIDPKEKVEIIPTMKREVWEGKMKEKRSVFIKQNGKTLQWYYKKGGVETLPEIEVIKKKSGAIDYDDYERNEFFAKLATEYNSKIFSSPEIKDIPVEDIPAASISPDEDDLPF